MDWGKSSAGLVELFAELAPKDKRVQQKKMFGWPCCFVNLFTRLHKESAAFLRLDGAARSAAKG